MSIKKAGQNVQAQPLQAQGLQAQKPAVQATQAGSVEQAEVELNANQFETGTISQNAQGDIPGPNAQVVTSDVKPMSLSQLMLGNEPEIAINPFPDTTGETGGVTTQTTEPEIAINPFPDTNDQTDGGGVIMKIRADEPITGQTDVNAQTDVPEIAINPFPDTTGETGVGIGVGQTDPAVTTQTTEPEIAINPFPDTPEPEIAINPFPDTTNDQTDGGGVIMKVRADEPLPGQTGQTGQAEPGPINKIRADEPLPGDIEPEGPVIMKIRADDPIGE